MSSNSPIKLRIPPQDLAEFGVFPLDVPAAQQWAKSLPVTNSRQVITLLSQAVADLNRVELTPDTRFAILEVLRPTLLISLTTLSKRFLQQPLILPEEPRQMAEQADKLLSLTTTAYTIAAIHTIQRRDTLSKLNPARLVAESIHRALDMASRRILQTFQLYHSVELHSWLEVHQLFALADRQQLANIPIADRIAGNSTIARTYLRVQLLAACKPNQLRQSDLAALYLGLHEWADKVVLQTESDDSGLFLVDLSRDQPPVYRSVYEPGSDSDCRFIDTAELLLHLEQLQKDDELRGRSGVVFDKDHVLPSNILTHMINCLGTMSSRNFARDSSENVLWISLGLSNTHYHIAGGKTFERLLYGDNYVAPPEQRVGTNRFLLPQERRDNWEQADPHDDHDEVRPQNDDSALEIETYEVRETPPEERFPIHRAHMVNASPGGYCLQWTHDLPSGIKTGDVVGVREGDNKNWVIAVIRWVSQIKDSETLVGIELMSPRGMPFGAKVHKKVGDDSELSRVLLLPEIKLVGQPHTLITHRSGFKENDKVTLLREGEEFYIQLLRQLTTTASFSQFDFRYIKQLEKIVDEETSSDPKDADYNSLWESI